MGRIQTSIGLITGTAINDTVDQLIKLSALPRDRLMGRSDQLREQQSAITGLTAMVIGMQLATRRLGQETLFTATKAHSANEAALSVSRTGQPTAGVYRVQTLQRAETHAAASRSLAASASSPLGVSGTLSIATGGFIDNSVSLDQLNGGRGVSRGAIRISDRSGASAIVDLTGSQTIEEVLRKINDTSGIRVRAGTDGDAITLTDRSGSTAGSLRVEEVGGGSTAADLGLSAIDLAADHAVGADIYRLTRSTTLSSLRDGQGIGFNAGADMRITFADGTTADVDFGDLARPAAKATATSDAGGTAVRLTLSATEAGSDWDNTKFRVVDDPALAVGEVAIDQLDGPGGRELIFRARAGETTVADLQAAVAADAELATALNVTFDGDGSGTLSTGHSAAFGYGENALLPDEPTLGDLLRVLNEVDPDRLEARLAPDGDRLQLVDLTAGAETFRVEEIGQGRTAADLGLDGSADGATLSGDRLRAGLEGKLLSSLLGPAGSQSLGMLELRTRDGALASIDLTGATSLNEVVGRINQSGAAVRASLNDQGTALQLRDLSGGDSTLLRLTHEGSDSGSLLGLALGETDDTLIQGSPLTASSVTRHTKLADLNQGRGVDSGSIRIRDANGAISAFSLKTDNIENVGQLIDRINGLGLAVEASIAPTGDGIRLISTGAGSGELKVEEVGTRTAASDLGIKGTAAKTVVDGQIKAVIDGRQTDTVTINAGDSLESIAQKINDASRYATAAVVAAEGGGSRLVLTSRRGGEDGRLAVHTEGFDFGFQTAARGRDAVASIGQEGGQPLLFRSADGVFKDAIPGLSLTLKEVSPNPITVTVDKDPQAVVSAVKGMVEQYNKLAEQVSSLTFFNPEEGTRGLLFGTNEALRIESGFTRIFSGRLSGAGPLASLGEIGVSLNDSGRLELSESRLLDRLADNPEGVAQLLGKEETGLAARIDELTDRLAGPENSLLLTRNETLNRQIDRNSERVESLNLQLDRERERLLRQFHGMEAAIARLQTNQQALSQLQIFEPLR